MDDSVLKAPAPAIEGFFFDEVRYFPPTRLLAVLAICAEACAAAFGAVSRGVGTALWQRQHASLLLLALGAVPDAGDAWY